MKDRGKVKHVHIRSFASGFLPVTVPQRMATAAKRLLHSYLRKSGKFYALKECHLVCALQSNYSRLLFATNIPRATRWRCSYQCGSGGRNTANSIWHRMWNHHCRSNNNWLCFCWLCSGREGTQYHQKCLLLGVDLGWWYWMNLRVSPPKHKHTGETFRKGWWRCCRMPDQRSEHWRVYGWAFTGNQMKWNEKNAKTLLDCWLLQLRNFLLFLLDIIINVNTTTQYWQDQLILFMALADGLSVIKTGPLTLHTETSIFFASLLTGVSVNFLHNTTHTHTMSFLCDLKLSTIYIFVLTIYFVF